MDSASGSAADEDECASAVTAPTFGGGSTRIVDTVIGPRPLTCTVHELFATLQDRRVATLAPRGSDGFGSPRDAATLTFELSTVGTGGEVGEGRDGLTRALSRAT